MADIDAHELVKTRDCKVGGCDEDAVDARGRFAGLCADHKRVAIAEARAAGTFGVPHAGISDGQLAKTGGELARRARRVERASKKLDQERAELRNVYLRFGVEAGFLGGRS